MFVACLGQILLYLDVLENGSAAAHPCTANLISYILTHVLHITATYSGIEEQSEKGRVEGREAVYAARYISRWAAFVNKDYIHHR